MLQFSSSCPVSRDRKVAQQCEAVKADMAVPEQDQHMVTNSQASQNLKRKRSCSAGSDAIKDDELGTSAPVASFDSRSNVSHSASVPNENDNLKSVPAVGTSEGQWLHRGDSIITNGRPAGPKDDNPRPSTTPNLDANELRQILESQLSLEILLKHDELRMIEQEMAKCQVALEQLRRCAEIPYPGSSLTGPLSAVSNGSGPAVMQRNSLRVPVSPSPWGTSDGAYTRHYARWLLPDMRFDSGELEALPPPEAGNGVPDGRTTRASWSDSTMALSRSQRGSSGAKLQALSSGYPPPKEKAGPMIIKRKSDGVYVKLVCLDCRRDNFSSTQGFINHCRIAHNRSFASHDAAASASGEPVEVNEAGAVVGPQSESQASSLVGYVHPLIRSALQADSAKGPQSRQPITASVLQQTTYSPSLVSKLKYGNWSLNKSDSSPETVFKASPKTPHLSSLLHWKGVDMDLSRIVDDALTKPDLDSFFSDNNSDTETEDTPRLQSNYASSQLSIRNNSLPTRTVYNNSLPQRPLSRKGMDKRNTHHASPGPLRTSSILGFPVRHTAVDRSLHSDRDVDMPDSTSPHLSPNTVESNQAPSLVSDDGEEYEARSESESPTPSSSESESEENELDNIEVQGDDYTSANPNASDTTSHLSGPAKHHTRPPIPATSTSNTTMRKESFSNPKHTSIINSRTTQKPAATSRSHEG